MKIHKTIKKILIGGLSLLIVISMCVTSYMFYSRYEVRIKYTEIKNYNEGYIYSITNEKYLNIVYYVAELKDTSELINYYLNEENPNSAPSNFTIISVDDKIETRAKKISSNVYEFYMVRKDCWGMIKGFIYHKHFYSNKPNVDMLKEHFDFVSKRIRKKPGISQFGFQCD